MLPFQIKTYVSPSPDNLSRATPYRMAVICGAKQRESQFAHFSSEPLHKTAILFITTSYNPMDGFI